MSEASATVGDAPSQTPIELTLDFIVDAPAIQDELDAHAPIATAIATVVRGADRIKMIGLLGGWGSGKSTVAQLAKDALEKSEVGKTDYRCFTFDAWQHQSDPPRRAFLEALAQFLETDKAFKDLRYADPDPIPEWKQKLEDLRVLTEKVTTTTTPTLTLPGRVLALSAIGLPIGLKLIGDGTLSATDQRDTAASAMFALAWILATAPIIAILAFYVLWRPWSTLTSIRTLKDARAFLKHHKASRADHSILSLVANKAVEQKTDVRKKTPDPTAIEFQDSFRDMIAAAHTDKRRLVLIIDNLDRLPAEEAKAIWSTVRSLFLGGDAKRKIKREDLPTVIMPIDASSIAKMYGGRDPNLSRSFLEKTFDLVFHVPTPVLSRWHRYMHDKLEAVFKTHASEQDISNIRSIYERKLGGEKPTPRSINNFVNAVAVLWLQRRHDKIDIAIVAYYVTERDAFTQNFDMALESEVELLESIDADWRTGIAALHSGLSRTDAAELFMGGPIRIAIEAGDAETFKALFKRPGFDRYLLRVLRTSAPDGERLSVFSAARLLGEEHSQAWMGEAWAKLRSISLNIDADTTFGKYAADAVAYLAHSVSGPERTRYISAMAIALAKAAPTHVSSEGGKPFGELADRLVKLAQEDGIEGFAIEVPGGAPRFFQMLLQGLSDTTMRGLLPSSGTTADQIVVYLADRLTETDFHRGIADAAAALARRESDGID